MEGTLKVESHESIFKRNREEALKIALEFQNYVIQKMKNLNGLDSSIQSLYLESGIIYMKKYISQTEDVDNYIKNLILEESQED